MVCLTVTIMSGNPGLFLKERPAKYRTEEADYERKQEEAYGGVREWAGDKGELLLLREVS